MSKPRSPLLTMPEAHQAKLAQWLLSGMDYHTARELCSKEFGVTVKSTSGFANFWQVVCEPALLRQRARAVQTADVIAQSASERNSLDQAIVDQIKQKSFELMIRPNIDPKELTALLSLYGQIGNMEIQKAKLDQSRQALELKLKQYEDHVTEKKRKIEAALQQGSKDGSITPEAFSRVEEMLNLL